MRTHYSTIINNLICHIIISGGTNLIEGRDFVNWFRKVNNILVITLVLTIPMISFAKNDFNVLEEKPNKHHYEHNDEKKEEKFRRKKDLPEDVKMKLQELKTKLINGEITEEEFQKEVDKVFPKNFKHKDMKKNLFKNKVNKIL